MARALLILALLFPLAIGAAEIRQLTVEREKGLIKVASETYIDAPPVAVFEILSDYDGFHRISNVFTDTRYLERDENGNGRVYSKAEGCVLFFCTTIERVERLELTPATDIVATAIPEESDVEYSVAHWRFEPEGEGTSMIYAMEFRPSFWIPPVLGPMIIRAKLRSRGETAADRIEVLANETVDESAAP